MNNPRTRLWERHSQICPWTSERFTWKISYELITSIPSIIINTSDTSTTPTHLWLSIGGGCIELNRLHFPITRSWFPCVLFNNFAKTCEAKTASHRYLGSLVSSVVNQPSSGANNQLLRELKRLLELWETRELSLQRKMSPRTIGIQRGRGHVLPGKIPLKWFIVDRIHKKVVHKKE